ncbi:MAG: adenylate/guanylate cyclase domain-containing protein [Chitinophagales bacterium]|nr:adenylate/guanylate cyclase domain-containing protein [Chitinophagales bacterium]
MDLYKYVTTIRIPSIVRRIKRWMSPRFDPAFEERFRVELSKSELLRINILIRATIAGAIGGCINFFIIREEKVYTLLINLLPVFSITVLILLIYEFSTRAYVKKCIQQKKPVSISFQIINLIAESSFPTLMMLLLLTRMNTIVLLSTPFTLLYFLFIVLSTLHLEFRLSVLTGFVAAAGYFLAAKVLIHVVEIPQGTSPLLISTTIILGRSFVIFICGVASGFVALEIKRRVINTYQAVNDRDRIRLVLGQHVSHAIVDQIINEKKDIHNKRLFVAVMFLDIRDFTPLVEKLEPEEVLDFQNRFFGIGVEVVNKYHGIIHQFMGDGFMATFGAPFSSVNDCQNAVDAAFGILKKTREAADQNILPLIRLGIGIHAGEVITGNIGTDLRKQYSIVGNVVIQAARIEQLNKEFHSQLLISRNVLEKIKNENPESLGKIKLKGESSLLEIFRLA